MFGMDLMAMGGSFLNSKGEPKPLGERLNESPTRSNRICKLGNINVNRKIC